MQSGRTSDEVLEREAAAGWSRSAAAAAPSWETSASPYILYRGEEDLCVCVCVRPLQGNGVVVGVNWSVQLGSRMWNLPSPYNPQLDAAQADKVGLMFCSWKIGHSLMYMMQV